MPRPPRKREARSTIAKPPPAFPSMRIGLLGGSFNPAHEGHRQISLAAIKRLQLHKLWWLITPGNPLKKTDQLPGLDDRLAYARHVASHPKIEVTGFEADLPTPYSLETITYLQRRYPSVDFVWIVGGDVLVQFHHWRNWQRIFLSIPILVADRPGFRHAALASPAARRFAAAQIPEDALGQLTNLPPPAWSYLSLPLCEVSATAIRRARMRGNFHKPA